MAKILLVEDDKSLREIYGVRLMAEGYEIVSAGDGEEALAMAIKERPNLIISDVMMPKISGFDMLDILRSTTETKDVKVIMMTALSSEDQRARGEALGADRYLVKSQVGIEDVVRTVHEVIGDSIKPAPAPQFGPGAVPITPAVPEAATPAPAPLPTAEVPQPAAPPEVTPAPVAEPQPAPVPAEAPLEAPIEMPAAPVAQAPEVAAPAAAPVIPAPVATPEPAPAFTPAPQPESITPAPIAVTPQEFTAPPAPIAADPAPIAPLQPAPITTQPPVAIPEPVTPVETPVVTAAPQPAAPVAPTPAVAPAPAPQPQAESNLPQPTAPFSSPAPASLGERVIEPLVSAAPAEGLQDISAQIATALGEVDSTQSAQPPQQ